jgi:ribonuclease P protein component
MTAALKTPSDFQRVSRSGKKWVAPAFIMQVLKTEEDGPFRLGLTVSRKVGNAVVRNRVKRRLREVVRAAGVPGGHDIVLIGRTEAASRDFALLKEDLLAGLTKLGVMR